MKARTTRLAVGAALALVTGPTRAADPQPDALEQEPPADDQAPLDITGRLRASRNTLSLEIGGALLELRIFGDPLSSGEAPGSGDPRAHDFRASFSVDGKTTNLMLRFVPPRGSETPTDTK
jgi:hypothetical protein